jgi:hypothetical protein
VSLASWPKTICEAVDLIFHNQGGERGNQGMAEDDLIFLHLGFGETIRNKFGLRAGNKDLLPSCGSGGMHPDDALMVIVKALWRSLQTKH